MQNLLPFCELKTKGKEVLVALTNRKKGRKWEMNMKIWLNMLRCMFLYTWQRNVVDITSDVGLLVECALNKNTLKTESSTCVFGIYPFSILCGLSVPLSDHCIFINGYCIAS